MRKLEKIERDIERAQEKAREWQAKAKELDGQLTEAENTEIVSTVRALKLTREELRAFMKDGKLPAKEQAAIPAAMFQKATTTVKSPYFEDRTEDGTNAE
jgi:hypothetical protein